MSDRKAVPQGSGEEMKYFVSLDSVSRTDSLLVGNKAATLGELLSSGFPVPNGYVLTTKAFERVSRASGNENTDTTQSGELQGFSLGLIEAISEVLLRLGDGLLAVRSSGVNEDLPNSSFAGQYETVLGVRGKEELIEAVKKCWNSQFGKRAIEYGQNHSSGPNGDMAVLIQKLVRADSSGVAFTRNPLTGANEVVTNAIQGLGDRLVSGAARPDEWIVNETAVCTKNNEDAITDEQAIEIARLARDAERHFGIPQDIEWAISGGRLYLLQARPITTKVSGKESEEITPVPIPVVVPDGYWTHGREFLPRPVSPMFASYGTQEISHWMRQLSIDVGLPFDGIEWRLIGGWAYGRIVPPGGKDRKPPPRWMLSVLVKIVPSIRSRVERMVRVARSDVIGGYIEKWNNEWKIEIVKGGNQLLSVKLDALADSELEAHLSAVFAHSSRAKEIHFRYLAFTMMDIGAFAVELQDQLKWSNLQVFDLFAGVVEKDSEPGRRLAELVNYVRSNQRLIEAVQESIRTRDWERPLSVDEQFASLFNLYIMDFGRAALGYEVIDPTFEEMPLEVLRLIGGQVSANFDPSVTGAELEERRKKAEGELDRANLLDETKRQLKRDLARARRAYALHDEEAFYNQNMSDGIVRRALLELGRRLEARGVVESKDDVFMLTLDEAKQSFRNGEDRRQLVKRRKGERLWAFQNPGPPSYGPTPPPPPPVEVFPPEAQKLLRSMMWVLGGISLGRATTETGPLRGTPGSSGSYDGTVRVIREESEFEKLRPGDILVCPSFPPSWSVIFPTIGALVTEVGGALSHPAIVAREYGVPAVLSLEGATQKLKDGQLIRVDGDNGVVIVLP
jgi:rifampicin phosphotransferase